VQQEPNAAIPGGAQGLGGPQGSPKKPPPLPDAIPADAWQSLAGLFSASWSGVLHAAGGGDFGLFWVFFFLPHFPRGKKQSVLGDEVLATIYIGRFAIFHASPGSGIFIV